MPKPALSTDGNCLKTIADARSAVLAAERIPANSTDNAFERYTKLEALGLRGDTSVLEVLEPLENNCGQSTADRIVVYDAWAQVLRDQTVEAVSAKRPECRKWLQSATRYDIALNVDNVSTLASRFGTHDPDVRHIKATLDSWAKQEGIRIPQFANRVKIEHDVSSYAREYDITTANSPPNC